MHVPVTDRRLLLLLLLSVCIWNWCSVQRPNVISKECHTHGHKKRLMSVLIVQRIDRTLMLFLFPLYACMRACVRLFGLERGTNGAAELSVDTHTLTVC